MKKKKAKYPKRLIRYLERGQSLRVIGAHGKPVKQIVSGRKYVLEVRQNRKTVGYINNSKRGVPVAKEFTKSMISRLKHTRREMITRPPTQTPKTFTIHNKKYVKYQIPEKIFKELKKTKKRAFGFRIKVGTSNVYTPFVYTEGRMSKKDLKNLITSNILMTINMQNYRISPLLKGQKEIKRVRRVKEAHVTLSYMDVDKPVKKRKKKVKLPKDR